MAGCVVQMLLACRDLRVGRFATGVARRRVRAEPDDPVLRRQWHERVVLPLLPAGVPAAFCAGSSEARAGRSSWVDSPLGSATSSATKLRSPRPAAVAVVLGVTFVRSPGRWRQRAAPAGSDAVVLRPSVCRAFVGWAVVSYVITGQLFGQLSSEYGNASQIKIIGGVGGADTAPRSGTGRSRCWGYMPLLPVVAFAVVVVAWRRRDLHAAALAVPRGTGRFHVHGLPRWPGVRLVPVLPTRVPLGLLAVVSSCRAHRGLDRRRSAGRPSSCWSASPAWSAPASSCGTEFAPADHGGLAWVFSGKAEGSYQLVQRRGSPAARHRRPDRRDGPPRRFDRRGRLHRVRVDCLDDVESSAPVRRHERPRLRAIGGRSAALPRQVPVGPLGGRPGPQTRSGIAIRASTRTARRSRSRCTSSRSRHASTCDCFAWSDRQRELQPRRLLQTPNSR